MNSPPACSMPRLRAEARPVLPSSRSKRTRSSRLFVFPNDLRRPVLRAIINDDEFKIGEGLPEDAFDRFGDILFAVVHGHDNGHQRRRIFSHAHTPCSLSRARNDACANDRIFAKPAVKLFPAACSSRPAERGDRPPAPQLAAISASMSRLMSRFGQPTFPPADLVSPSDPRKAVQTCRRRLAPELE